MDETNLRDGSTAEWLMVELLKDLFNRLSEDALDDPPGMAERVRLAVRVKLAKRLAEPLGEEICPGSSPLRKLGERTSLC